MNGVTGVSPPNARINKNNGRKQPFSANFLESLINSCKLLIVHKFMSENILLYMKFIFKNVMYNTCAIQEWNMTV